MAKDHEEEEEVIDEEVEDADVTDEDDKDDAGDNKDEDPDALKDDDIEKDTDVKSLQAKLKKANIAKKQLTARAKAAEATKKNNSASPTKPNQARKPASDHTDKRLANLETIEAKRTFGYENGLSPEETDLAFKYSNGKPSKKILSDPFFKAGLDGMRAAKKTAANIPGATRRSSVYKNKSFGELTRDERKAAHEERMKALRG